MNLQTSIAEGSCWPVRRVAKGSFATCATSQPDLAGNLLTIWTGVQSWESELILFIIGLRHSECIPLLMFCMGAIAAWTSFLKHEEIQMDTKTPWELNNFRRSANRKSPTWHNHLANLRRTSSSDAKQVGFWRGPQNKQRNVVQVTPVKWRLMCLMCGCFLDPATTLRHLMAGKVSVYTKSAEEDGCRKPWNYRGVSVS